MNYSFGSLGKHNIARAKTIIILRLDVYSNTLRHNVIMLCNMNTMEWTGAIFTQQQNEYNGVNKCCIYTSNIDTNIYIICVEPKPS